MLNEYETVAEWLEMHKFGLMGPLLRKDHVGSQPTHYGFDIYDFFLTGYARARGGSEASLQHGQPRQRVHGGTGRRGQSLFHDCRSQRHPYAVRSDRRGDDPLSAETAGAAPQEHSDCRHDLRSGHDAWTGAHKIENLGIDDNTYIIYRSDNGAAPLLETTSPSSVPSALWEGGIRVPFIVKGPGIAPNSVSYVPVIGLIFRDGVGVSRNHWRLDPMLEAPRCVPVLHNGGQLPEGTSLQRAFGQNGELFFHLPMYTDVATPMSAVRDGDYKLVKVYGQNGGDDQIFLIQHRRRT